MSNRWLGNFPIATNGCELFLASVAQNFSCLGNSFFKIGTIKIRHVAAFHSIHQFLSIGTKENECWRKADTPLFDQLIVSLHLTRKALYAHVAFHIHLNNGEPLLLHWPQVAFARHFAIYASGQADHHDEGLFVFGSFV